MKKFVGITLSFTGLLVIPASSFAFQRMAGSTCPMAAGGWIACLVSGLVCLSIIGLFFWLLIRIARALERIADSKTTKN